MKFIVSNLRPEYVNKNSNRLYFLSQYSAYTHYEGFNKNENVADFLYTQKKEFEEASDFVTSKYEMYISIIGKRLNVIHGLNLSNEFWKRSISLGLYRQITYIFDMYSKCNEFFDPLKHDCKILDPENYQINISYEEDRTYYQSSLGQEQLFSIYINKFFPGTYSTFDYEDTDDVSKGVQTVNKKSLLKRIFRKDILYRIGNRLAKKMYGQEHRIKVGILGSYFSKNFFNHLFHKSMGKINYINFEIEIKDKIKFDFEKRKKLGENEEWMDQFDQLFFSFLEYSMPSLYVEEFQNILKQCTIELNKYPKLQYIVSESWLNSTKNNIFRALAYEMCNAKTLYNEHNCIFHPFVGGIVDLEADLVDKYLTFGWTTQDQRFLKSASLFEFGILISSEKKYDILYVSYPAVAIRPSFDSSYSSSDFGAIKHLKFVNKFFALLSTKMLKKMYYRGYPKDYYILGQRYDKEAFLNQYLKQVNIVSALKTKGESSKQQMATSRIVVIDMLSTAYLESLMMDIPTIAFFDPTVMFLSDEYADYFDLLIDAKIIHTSPESAVKHLEEIYNDPFHWWNSNHTQKNKNKWLSNNFGKPKTMLDLLINLAADRQKID